MEEEKAAAYYDELTRKGEGAAKFKQGLGFSSASSDVVPSRGSALPSSSFLSKFVKASSPSKTSELEKQAQLESIQGKLKKKPEKSQPDSSSRVLRDKDREKVRSRRRTRSRSRDKERRRISRSRSRDSGRHSRRRSRSRSRDGGSRHSRRRSRSRSRDVGRSSRRRNSWSQDCDKNFRRRSRSLSKSRDSDRNLRRLSRSLSKSRDSDMNSRRRSRSLRKSRDRNKYSSKRGRSRSRSSSRDGYDARKKGDRSRSRETERLDRKKRNESPGKKSLKITKIDYGELISGYDNMTSAERVKAKMKLQLSETAGKDETKGVGSGWERFNFDKYAPLDDEEIEAAEDDKALMKQIGQTFRYSAVESRREDEIKTAHDEAMFGAPSLSTSAKIYVEREDGKLSPVGSFSSDQVHDVTEVESKKEEIESTPLSDLLSAQALSMQLGSWRDRVRKL